jgi:hypothetical protein
MYFWLLIMLLPVFLGYVGIIAMAAAIWEMWSDCFGFGFLNPYNLYDYTGLDISGSICLAILFNIAFIPVAIVYWIYKAIRKLCGK